MLRDTLIMLGFWVAVIVLGASADALERIAEALETIAAECPQGADRE